MTTSTEKEFLTKAYAAAVAAQHVFPEMAACEAALESGWGLSELATKANNLFGQKQAVHPQFGTLILPTKEFLGGKWITEDADWVSFPTVADCFTARMATLERLAPQYPHYAAALAAKTPEEYVTQVSMSWSTDPQRAAKCIETYRAHAEVFPPDHALI
jgi:flagellum-specific peptidoglycan hydrolase FlgJ